jgi:hypothetical protein
MAGLGTNATKKPGQIIAYRGKADSIETSLFSLLMTRSGHAVMLNSLFRTHRP